MMAVVIATAGHIDHGKTALVRALTGQDTDRLPEEKARGISIDLGFAHLDFADGERAGVVDVPGHERFIRNMLAGAHHVDVVLFVVAADDGVMPQTEEHLDILHLLGVRRGIFVVTKIDLVDAARVAAVREEIEILALDTTLEGAPILPVSTVTGDGLPALRAAIAHQLHARPTAPSTVPFRLPVDRAFVMHGHGVVVTGTAVAGRVHEGDVLHVLPGGQPVRVRGLEVHGVRVAEAGCGQRVAMNLAGADRGALRRGVVACGEGIDRTSDRFDAWMEVRPSARRPLASHTRVRVHVATADVVGKVVVLDGDAIAPRGRGWAQVVLREPVVASRGDRFVVRDETARRTLGGGIVVNPFASPHKRGEAGLADRLVALRDGDTAIAARTLLALAPSLACERTLLIQALVADGADLARALHDLPDVIPIPDASRPEAYATAEKWDGLVDAVVRLVECAHRERPNEPGLDMEHVRSQVAPEVPSRIFRWCVDRLVATGRLARDESVLRLPSHTVALDAADRDVSERIEHVLVGARFTPPDLRVLEQTVGIPRPRLIEILTLLEKEGRVARVAGDLYYARAAADETKALVAAHCRAHGDISAATFRDLIGASRKYAIALLDWFDRTGFTTRVGDMRRLRRDVR